MTKDNNLYLWILIIIIVVLAIYWIMQPSPFMRIQPVEGMKTPPKGELDDDCFEDCKAECKRNSNDPVVVDHCIAVCPARCPPFETKEDCGCD